VLRLRTFAALGLSVLLGVVAAWGYLADEGKVFFAEHPSLSMNWVLYGSAGLLGLGAWGLEQMKEHRG
jgi:hypothetical protein